MPRSPSTVRVTGVVGDHLAREPRRASSGSRLDDGVHVGGGAADVDDDHVAGTRALGVEAAGQQLDAGQHDVGGRAAHHRREVGAGAEVLAADHVGQEHLADRGPGRRRARARRSAAPRCRRARAASRPPGSPRPRRGPRRCRPPRPGRPAGRDQRAGRRRAAPRRCRRRCRRSAAPRRAGRPRARPASPSSATAGDDRDDLAAAGQRHPAAGLGGDQLLVADHGDPQPAAGAGAGQHLGVGRARVLRATSAARQASYPSSTSVSIVVGCAGRATSRPRRRRSTSAALVNVEPKSTQTTERRASLGGSAPRARSRSAIRSSAVSMPTLSRIRSAGTSRSVPATLAWVIRPGCSISDSTPPSDSPRVNTSARVAHRERLLLAAGDPERHDAAEPLHLLAPRPRGRGARAARGRSPRRPAGARSRKSTTRSALSQCRSIRTPSVLSPRSVSQASNGPGDRADGVLVEGDLLGQRRGRARRARRRRRRSGRRSTSWSSARPRRRRGSAAAGGTARRRCCRRRAARRPRGRPRPAPRCRRC